MADTTNSYTKMPLVGTALFRRLQVGFWTLFIALPILTGLLAYRWLPNESFDEKRHELVAGHEVGDRFQDHGISADIWKDKKTGEIFTPARFAEHRKMEARRMAVTWFGYGLVGCLFFAWVGALKGQGRFFVAFGKAVALNLVIAGYMFLSI